MKANPNAPQLVDTRHLPEKVNGLRWMAAQMLAVTKREQSLPPKLRQETEQAAAFLDMLGRRIAWTSNNPVLMMAVGSAALSVQKRDELTALFAEIDRAIEEMEGGQAPDVRAPPPPDVPAWAPVPKD